MKTSLTLALGALLLASTAAPAQEEKTLNLFNWSNYTAPDVKNDAGAVTKKGTYTLFTEATGIQVVESNYDSNEMLEGILAPGHSNYDIVVPSGFYLQHQIPVGIYLKLDKSKLPNLANMDPDIMKATETFDPGNQYAVDYMWGTTGLGYNVDMLKARMPDAPLDSWDLLFKPENAKKFADCGITILDAQSEVIAIALKYLGLDANSEKPEDLKKAEELMDSIKPYIRKFDSSGYIDDLANGDACLSLGYSGDVYIARHSAEDAKNGINVRYVIPKEGTIEWFDMLAIPADAPHPENALAFMNFFMQPQITADVSNAMFYANGNKAAFALTDPAITSDPNIYPPPDVVKTLTVLQTHTPAFTQDLTRTWTRIKTGQ